ncbi:preprotein translocase subunit SecG [Candidatus Parcubacteria bacterium]|nr:MAG: preprotein translocase subunit SecG [Candidatus Parcubacteria bacterium]
MNLNIIQIVIGALLIVAILLQQRGTGLGSAFGAEGGFYRTRLGIEKFLLIGTVVLAIAFFTTAILNIAL